MIHFSLTWAPPESSSALLLVVANTLSDQHRTIRYLYSSSLADWLVANNILLASLLANCLNKSMFVRCHYSLTIEPSSGAFHIMISSLHATRRYVICPTRAKNRPPNQMYAIFHACYVWLCFVLRPSSCHFFLAAQGPIRACLTHLNTHVSPSDWAVIWITKIILNHVHGHLIGTTMHDSSRALGNESYMKSSFP